MSWRETIAGRSEGGIPLVGSFRGAKFIAPASEATFGRRAEVHEYPLRDKPWVEDLGGKARRYEIEVFVDSRLGDHLAMRDALIAAIEEGGPGTLVHPWHGTMTVSLTEPATVRESSREGGRTTFRLVFVEAGELLYPASGADTAVAVDGAADSAITASMDDFAQAYSVDGLPAWSLAAIEKDLYATLADVEALVGGVAGAIAAEIRRPANMAAAIIGAVQRVASMVEEPFDAIALYSRLFAAGDDSSTVPATTVGKRLAQNSAALHRLTRETAVVEAARSASLADFPTIEEALATAAVLLEALDSRMETFDPVSGAPVNDTVYQALAALRAAVAIDLRTRGARLPELSVYTPDATLPALVIAHRIHGDATRADEISGRNRISHPGFVAGGNVLEIIK